MEHEIKIIVTDEKVWKALCGASAVVKDPISKIVSKLVSMEDLAKSIADQLSGKQVEDAVKNLGLEKPYADLMAIKGDK